MISHVLRWIREVRIGSELAELREVITDQAETLVEAAEAVDAAECRADEAVAEYDAHECEDIAGGALDAQAEAERRMFAMREERDRAVFNLQTLHEADDRAVAERDQGDAPLRRAIAGILDKRGRPQSPSGDDLSDVDQLLAESLTEIERLRGSNLTDWEGRARVLATSSALSQAFDGAMLSEGQALLRSALAALDDTIASVVRMAGERNAVARALFEPVALPEECATLHERILGAIDQLATERSDARSGAHEALTEVARLTTEVEAYGPALADLNDGCFEYERALRHIADEAHTAHDALELARSALEHVSLPQRMYTFASFFNDKIAWSFKTFGPGDRYKGVVAHIRKELDEVEADPSDIEEWVDVALLAMDGAWRSAGANGRAFVDAMVAKDATNRKRSWPDWRDNPGAVTERIRDEDETIRSRGECRFLEKPLDNVCPSDRCTHPTRPNQATTFSTCKLGEVIGSALPEDCPIRSERKERFLERAERVGEIPSSLLAASSLTPMEDGEADTEEDDRGA